MSDTRTLMSKLAALPATRHEHDEWKLEIRDHITAQAEEIERLRKQSAVVMEMAGNPPPSWLETNAYREAAADRDRYKAERDWLAGHGTAAHWVGDTPRFIGPGWWEYDHSEYDEAIVRMRLRAAEEATRDD